MSDEPGDDECDATDDGAARPATRHAQKMASCVDAGPGSRLHAAIASSNSSAQPLLALDAQVAQQRDVRGWAAEADAADASPLRGDRHGNDGR